MEAPCKKASKRGEQWTASSSSSSFSAISNLPSHILMEIMFRLPIKTLAATKCVCKSWLHIINDPHFSKLRQARANVEVCFQSYVYSEAKTVQLYTSNFYDSNCIDMKLNTLLEFPKFSVKPNNVINYDAVRGKFTFVNSCNGLLCYCSKPNKFAVIWNPITCEYITLPAPKINKGLSTCRAYGLGFSQKANRFKLLRIMARKEKESSEEVVVAEICTIEKGCFWRNVGSCPYSIWRPFGPELYGASVGYFTYGRPLGSFLQSALHWLGADSYKTNMVIVSFDFEDEKFGEIPLPPDFKTTDSKYSYTTLGVLDGCLYITDRTDQSVIIWLMKKYGVQSSWTKVFSLQRTYPERDKNECCFPISYLDNGEILMMRNGNSDADLFLYNQDLNSVTVIGSGYLLAVVAFSPSFVTLKDSMMGYDVHVKSRCAHLKGKEMASPSWWKPLDQVVAKRSELQEPRKSQMAERLHAEEAIDVDIQTKMERLQAQIERFLAKYDNCPQGRQGVDILQEIVDSLQNEFNIIQARRANAGPPFH